MRLRQMRAILLVLLIVISPTAAATTTAQLRVAAASDLQAALPALVSRFEASSGVRIRVTYGSSGQFVTQIVNGAPFDVFLSADEDYAAQLVASGHGVADTLTPYAVGRLVVWARRDRGLDLRAGLPALADSRIRRIAVANPDHAPYGRAAVAALRAAGLLGSLQARLVLGENVSQAAQFVQSGNADAGLIARSLALTPALASVGTYADVPSAMHPPLRQSAVAISSSAQRTIADRFIAFLRDPASVALLQRFGFEAAP